MISVVAIVAMAVLICADVFMRLVFNSPIKGAYETLQLLILIAIFGGVAYTQSKKGHVHVLMILMHLPKKIGFTIFSLLSLIGTVTMGIVTWQSCNQVIRVMAAGSETNTWQIPWWPFELLATIGIAMFTITLLLDTCKYIGAIFNDELAEEMKLC